MRNAWKVLTSTNASNGGDMNYAPYLPGGERGKRRKWLPKIEKIEMCKRGYHLTLTPHQWEGDRVFLVEYKTTGLQMEYGKICVPSFRFLAEITTENCIDPQIYIRITKDLRGCNLTGANLPGAKLRGVNLRNADLSGANLSGADLTGAGLRGANLRGANMQSADMYHTDLAGADMIGANLQLANLRGANLRGANLSGCDLIGADLTSINLSNANMSNVNLTGTDLTES